MARRAANRELADLLVEAGWSAADLARAVDALGAAQGLDLRYDRTAVAHWLTGSRPRDPVPGLVAQALSRRIGRLVAASHTGLARAPHGPDSPVPGAPASAVDGLMALCRSDTDPVRRIRVSRTPYRLAGVTLPHWTGVAPPPDPGLGRRASPEDARLLRETTDLFAALSVTRGGGHGRAALAAYLADDVARLLVAPAPRDLHARLLSSAAELTHLLARMSSDCGHHGLAQRYFTTSLRLAHEADDRTTYAITLRAMSDQTLSLGHARQAADLARAAVDTVGRGASSDVRAFLLTQRARCHAAARRTRSAHLDLDAAEAVHATGAHRQGLFDGYPRAAFDYQRAEALHGLGLYEDAALALRQSLRNRAPGRHRATALTHARLAEVLTGRGELLAACAHWETFLDHYPHLRSARGDRALDRMRHTLRSFPRQRRARTLLERAHDLGPTGGPTRPG